MSIAHPTIAIVGRPNVGKSAIFNRIIGRKISIVHDQPGVTRDRIVAICESAEYPFNLVDTGGICATLEDGFADAVTMEADIAIETAKVILFVVDAKDGITTVDEIVSKKLRKTNVPIKLLINKADNAETGYMFGEFAKLGFGAGLPISAEHGHGFSELHESIESELKPFATEILAAQEEQERTGLRISLVGRPNVGKSSLINAILEDERTIVSDIAGTTRDSIDIPYIRDNTKHTLIDTAGLRQRNKMDSSVEIFSAMRSERSIRRSDICLIVIDCMEGVSSMDRKIARTIKDEKKPCLIVLNKFDLYKPDLPRWQRLELLEEHVRQELFFLSYAPFICTSALKGEAVQRIFNELQKIERKAKQNVPTTGTLNRALQAAMEKNPPATSKRYNKRIKLYYAAVTINEKYATIPVPNYILFVNDKRLMADNYEQYLSKQLRESFPATGIPVIFSIRSRRREAKPSER